MYILTYIYIYIYTHTHTHTYINIYTSLVAQMVKNLPAGDLGLIPGMGRSLEKGMATHSSNLAQRISWTEEPGGLENTYVYIFFFRFFSLTGYYEMSNIILCALQWDLVGDLFYIQPCMCVNPKPLICPCLTPFPFGNCQFVFCLWVYFCIVNKFVCIFFFFFQI